MTAFRGIETDPIRNFKFQVSFPSVRGGPSRAGFSRVSGLKEQTEVIEYREGTNAATPKKLPGQTTFDNIVLERGIGIDSEMIRWRRLITHPTAGSHLASEASIGANPDFQGVQGLEGGTNGNLVRRELEIALGDYYAERGDSGVWVWTATLAWPMSLEVGEFSGDGNEVALETVEFAHEGLIVEVP